MLHTSGQFYALTQMLHYTYTYTYSRCFAMEGKVNAIPVSDEILPQFSGVDKVT